MLHLLLWLPLPAFLIAAPLTFLLIGAAHRFDLTDKPDEPAAGGRKWHGRPVPNTGGVAIFAAIALPMLGALLALHLAPDAVFPAFLAALQPHLPGLRAQTPLALAILTGAGILHGLGLIDDRKRLGPYVKLLIQLAVAAGLAMFFHIRILEFLGTWWGLPGMAVSVALSIFWILAITNAMNFLDNMDGLSAGIGCIVAAIYLAANILGGQWFVAALAALLLGALAGFLVFNFPPAKIFMGDGGSLVLGFFLAIISIRTTYFGPPSSDPLLPAASPWFGVLMPLVVLAVPLYDLTSVTLIRLSQGKSPFVGDRNHFSHRLVRKGLSQRAAVLVIWMCTLATGLSGIMLRHVAPWQALLLALQTAAILLLLALLERATPSHPEEAKH